MKIPTKDTVRSTYNKPELDKKVNYYYKNKKALKEFVWHLMNNAWTNGYHTDYLEESITDND